MDTVFPFGFPAATAFYLVMYVATLVIHVAFMNYVLAGSAYVAVAGLLTRRDPPPTGLCAAAVLRDWLPFMLGAAITAGVAPLLFVQILYQHQFYTANLLGSHRWMAILPVLIAAFYLLYLLRKKVSGRISRPKEQGLRMIPWSREILPDTFFLATIVFACFAFVAYSWTENHLLSVQSQQTWARVYVEPAVFYRDPQLLPRLSVWFIGALPTMALLVSWQLWYAQQRGHQETSPEAGRMAFSVVSVASCCREETSPEARRMATLALVGLVLAVVCGIWYFAAAGRTTRSAFLGWLALPYLLLAIAGVALQTVAWWNQRKAPRFEARWLGWASLGAGLTLAGMTVTREAVRLSAIAGVTDITRLYAEHQRAAKVGGLPVFLLLFVLNGLVIFWCVRLVRHGRRPPPLPQDATPTP